MFGLSRQRLYLACQLCGWGLYAALLFTFFTGAPNLLTALYCAAVGALGFAQTHLLRLRIQRAGWTRLSPGPLVLRIVLSSGVMATVLIVFSIAGSIHVLHLFTWKQTSLFVSAGYWANNVILFTFWQVLYFGLHAMERAARADFERLQIKATAQEAELRALRSQLEPHFLFNCLNSLRTLIVENPERAQTMVDQLAGILRHALTPTQVPTLPLAKELAMVRDYLALESIRFEERLRVQLDIEPGALDVPVPVMLLQRMVENGIKHGIARLPEGGELAVSARCEESTLHLSVRNSAPIEAASAARAEENTGTGLWNARHQLRLLFGERATLALECPVTGTTLATVRIPLAS